MLVGTNVDLDGVACLCAVAWEGSGNRLFLELALALPLTGCKACFSLCVWVDCFVVSTLLICPFRYALGHVLIICHGCLFFVCIAVKSSQE